ncbi:general transcription factor IIH subunit 1-like [Branchiostoma floridae x Branchiostoma japonicum]
MSRSEDVLLMVSHVRHKKVEGTLFLMGERLAWSANSAGERLGVSHNYADIRSQKISPEGKAKIQLQLVLHTGDTCNFHFNNPEGNPEQLKDRDAVKELLQQLLPRFKSQVNKELEEKNRLLQEDPQLFQLYKDLVVSGVITAEEFWTNRAQTKQSNAPKGSQDIGVSASFLADIRPQSDGCNGIKYNLTADIIASIFKTYPAVKKTHAENVPHNLSEKEFWTRFFQSHYFHRDRINHGKDLFSDCAKNDEKDLHKIIQDKVKDSFLDLESLDETSLVKDEGYGNKSADTSTAPKHSVNQAIIRRFNYHSTMVLEACRNKRSPEEDILSLGLGGSGDNSNSSVWSQSLALGPPSKKARLRDAISYEDLGESTATSAPPLSLTGADRYLQGPSAIQQGEYTTSQDIHRATQQVKQEIGGYQADLPNVLPSSLAASVTAELSPGGVLMQAGMQQSLKELIPKDLQDELHSLYAALAELLRHFWQCFPVTTPALEEKVVRMRETLRRFQTTKMQPFQDKLRSQHLPTNLTDHLTEMINNAERKFSTWSKKRGGRP